MGDNMKWWGFKTLPYQNKIKFNQSRWANNSTVTPLFYICCYSAFLYGRN